MSQARYVTREGDMVDRICWEHYGEERGYLELVLGANPTLADYPPALPEGVVILLPDIENVNTAEETISLWS